MADKLVYFDCHARAEPIRMLYAFAGKGLDDERIKSTDWPDMNKADFPNGQLPVLHTSDGTLNQSTAIARYVAKKFGLVGGCLWEEALHDMVVENITEVMNEMKIYMFMLFGAPTPGNAEELKAETHIKVKQCLKVIQDIAKSRKRKYIVSDEIGLADVWFYNGLEFFKYAFPDIMEVTEWTKCFTERMQACEKFDKYLQSRPVPEYPV